MTIAIKQKALIYARVSSRGQRKDAHGLEGQEAYCRRYAASCGYEVVGVYCDDISGKLLKRPGMDGMLTFLNAQSEPYVVLIYDLSRLARDVYVHIVLRKSIASAGAILESPTTEIGDDPEKELSENIQASVNQHQRRSNARRMSQLMRERLQKGYWVFAPPIGYKYEKAPGHGKILVRDEPVATVLAGALEAFASGRLQTYAEVVRYLSARPEWPAERRARLSVERVKEIIARPHYSGYIDYPQWDLSLVAGKQEPLISYETHRKILDRMNGVANVPARADLNVEFPLRGFITCSCCEKPLSGCFSTSRNGTRHPYYLCQTRGCERPIRN
jgi:site-specific DNA recombinase